jgi:hypothetical protein
MSRGQCWASRLGGCSADITTEHLITKALLGKRVRIESSSFGTPGVDLSVRKLTANILCRDHNNELGRTADAEALRLLRHLSASHRPMELPGSHILRPPKDRRVVGVNWGRWLCKTHCNLMIAHGMTPDLAYVSYALLHPPSKPLYFFLAAGLGESLRLADDRDPVVGWHQLICDDETDSGCCLSFGGTSWVLSTAPIQRNGHEMIDRLRVFEQPTPLGAFRIVFDWDDEPGPL